MYVTSLTSLALLRSHTLITAYGLHFADLLLIRLLTAFARSYVTARRSVTGKKALYLAL